MLQRTRDLFQRWHHFSLWECVMDGMWESRRNDRGRIAAAKETLADPGRCRLAMLAAIQDWPISAQQHLSKVHTNRRPWLGQAACALVDGATEEETRIAWNFQLTPGEQVSANAIADELIAQWEAENA